VGTAATDDNPLDWRLAHPARLARTRINMMAKLKETGDSIGIHIVRHGRTAKLDGFGEDFDERGAESCKFRAGQLAGMASRANPSMEEGLVSVDIADAMEQRLVQQRGFNRCLALAEEGDKLFETDG